MNTAMNAALLIDIIERAGYVPDSYSGRGMDGKRCVSLATEDSVFTVLANLINEYGVAEAASELVRWTKQDSLGRRIVLYWPHVEWPEDKP